MSTPESMTSPTLVTRYGAPKRRLDRRGRRLLVVVALVLAVAATALVALVVNRPTISSKDVGFDVRDPSSIVVDVDVVVPEGQRGRCGVQALDERFTVVGYTEIDVTGTDDGGSAHRVPMRTTSLAVNGGVNRCWPLP
ncbi:hypothetical protein GCM10011512_19470 [Tersicoccus solisilvae]|uniref:DUF4307 domain-containing protein n=1 Tax=Tersicoccus solisilvae TaxID=1882339 RepID=A0ABQ1P7S6_9MICC|nr:DUF4307 domain-containing protein [Tersicoccus solisilvae]GGC92515.1 hypothetical protein GCM10011512_19470 [Tersicoccus solisilvae]